MGSLVSLLVLSAWQRCLNSVVQWCLGCLLMPAIRCLLVPGACCCPVHDACRCPLMPTGACWCLAPVSGCQSPVPAASADACRYPQIFFKYYLNFPAINFTPHFHTTSWVFFWTHTWISRWQLYPGKPLPSFDLCIGFSYIPDCFQKACLFYLYLYAFVEASCFC